ncbi:MAG: D-glycero-beta-D-manno-heptose 1,7-bisphosphate 7-phosphatase [Gammaproteobacteria bacterium]|jgi:D-glycero-D-manno-heptose 1,7-bisphosphate phosphatase|nr:D-glycero-beta-D-manno-heptose 1,7-bisphosphate 7-phosphatase [Gammaproteobacteria bacterium]
MTLNPARVVVLDRDGVINRESPEYIKSPAEWQPLPGALQAIAELKAAGYRVVVATNQSGLARGLFDLEALGQIHQRMLTAVADAGGALDGIFFCPHGPDAGCDCRKPAPGLLLQVAERFACGFENMVFIGDSARDLEAARAVGVRSILVRTGNGNATAAALAPDDDVLVVDDLAAAARALIAEGEPRQ